MKKLIILLLALSPCLAFAQMHLPGAKLLSTPNGKSAKESFIASGTADTLADTAGSGTAGSPRKYNASVLSTNFTIPLVRVNFLNKTSATGALASTSFLNSAGAGLTWAWGVIDQTTDKNGDVASTDFHNTFGLQLGFLFAANSASGATQTTTSTTTTTSTQSSSIFAIMGGISVLNIQVGAGYEFGTLMPGQKRGFMTIAYAIPVSALIDGGYKIFNPKPKSPTEP